MAKLAAQFLNKCPLENGIRFQGSITLDGLFNKHLTVFIFNIRQVVQFYMFSEFTSSLKDAIGIIKRNPFSQFQRNLVFVGINATNTAFGIVFFKLDYQPTIHFTKSHTLQAQALCALNDQFFQSIYCLGFYCFVRIKFCQSDPNDLSILLRQIPQTAMPTGHRRSFLGVHGPTRMQVPN